MKDEGTTTCKEPSENEQSMTEEELKSRYIAPAISQEEKRLKDRMAQFRLSLISPAIYHTHLFPSNAAYFDNISLKVLEFPNGKKKRVSRKTLERWTRDYREAEESGDGQLALANKERSDKGQSRVLTLELMMEIVRILQEVPQIKVTILRGRLIEEHIIQENDCSADTIRRFILAYDLRNKMVIEERIRRSFVYPEFGQFWESDSCYLTKIPVGASLKWVYIQGIIDDHSRKLIALICYMADSAENFINTLKDAILRFGIPSMLYVDNGAPFISDWLISACNSLGIHLIHTRANDGASKGVIERAWFSLEIEVVPKIILDKVDTLEGVQKAVDDFKDKYNARVNRGVNGIPNERHKASLERRIHIMRYPKSTEWLTDKMLLDDFCHVYNDNTIQKDNVRYAIPDEIVGKIRKGKGKTLNVRYDPSDVQHTIHTVIGDKKYYLLIDDREANASRKRNTGGRQEQVKENMKTKEQKKMTLAEQRAEERFERRMAGIDLSKLYNLSPSDEETAANENEKTDESVNKTDHVTKPVIQTVETDIVDKQTSSTLEIDYSMLY